MNYKYSYYNVNDYNVLEIIYYHKKTVICQFVIFRNSLTWYHM